MSPRIVCAFLAALAVCMVAAASLYGQEPTAPIFRPKAAAVAPTPAPAPAPPAVTPPTPDSPANFMSALWDAAKAGRWHAAAALLLIGLVWLIRREQGTLAQWWPWLATPRGGAILVMVLGALAELGVDLYTKSQAPPGTVVLGAVAVRKLVLSLFSSPPKGPPKLVQS